MKKFDINKFSIKTTENHLNHYLVNGKIDTVGTSYNSVTYDGKFICQYIYSNEYGIGNKEHQPFEYVYSQSNPVKTILFLDSLFERHKQGKGVFKNDFLIEKQFSQLREVFGCEIVKSSVQEMAFYLKQNDIDFKNNSKNPNDYLFEVMVCYNENEHELFRDVSYREYLDYSNKYKTLIADIYKNLTIL